MEVRKICRRKEKVVDKYRLIRYNTKRTAGGRFVYFDFHCGEGVLMARGRFSVSMERYLEIFLWSIKITFKEKSLLILRKTS